MAGSGLRIARLFGIDIHVDWSWTFIFLLVTWNLAVALFPDLHPDWGPALNWGLAILASLLFFASVLAHELAHSLVALARGLPVNRITLFLFGGVANIEREPPSAKTEFLMAIVGPVTSIGLGVIFLLLAGVTAGGIEGSLANPLQALAGLNPLTTMLLWLGPINIVLGIFNMIPGFPLDGGRVLRSILWAITDNMQQATRWASLVGQAVGWLFIALGISMALGVQVPLLGTGLLGGLWLAFIGWFLNNAARSSYQQVVVRGMLEGITVSRLMRSDVRGVPVDTSLDRLMDDWIMASDERAFPVMEGDRLAGVVALEDIRKVPRAEWMTTRVGSVMTPAENLATVGPREAADEALQKILQKDVRQMPVMQNGQLVGMLRRRDIMRWLQAQTEYAGRE